MDTKITIIEGPPPIFEPSQEGWSLSLTEGPTQVVSALTRLRTFNGPQLVERCYRAWRSHQAMHLVYKNDMGLIQETPIQAARSLDTEEGQVLLLWVYLDPEVVEFEIDRGEDDNQDDGFEH